MSSAFFFGEKNEMNDDDDERRAVDVANSSEGGDQLPPMFEKKRRDAEEDDGAPHSPTSQGIPIFSEVTLLKEAKSAEELVVPEDNPRPLWALEEDKDEGTASSTSSSPIPPPPTATIAEMKAVSSPGKGLLPYVLSLEEKTESQHILELLQTRILEHPDQKSFYMLFSQCVRFAPLRIRSEYSAERPIFFCPVPQTPPFGPEPSFLCGRMKRKRPFLRISMDQAVVRKKGNPKYIGKVSFLEESYASFIVKLWNRQSVLRGKVQDVASVAGEKLIISLEGILFNRKEAGAMAQSLVGNIQTYVAPMLSLSVQKSDRIAFMMTCSAPPSPQKSGGSAEDFLFQFDYPLNLFAAFAICAAVQCRQQKKRRT